MKTPKEDIIRTLQHCKSGEIKNIDGVWLMADSHLFRSGNAHTPCSSCYFSLLQKSNFSQCEYIRCCVGTKREDGVGVVFVPVNIKPISINNLPTTTDEGE